MNNKIYDSFYNNFKYAVVYIAWDGERFIRCNNEKRMNDTYNELKECYTYVRKIKVENIEGGVK